MNESCPFVNDFILYVNIFTDCNFSEYNTISDNSTFSDVGFVTDDRVLDITFDDRALVDDTVADFGLCSDELRLGGGVCGVDLKIVREDLKLAFRIEHIHVRFPKGLDSSDIFPIAFERIGEQSLAGV